MRPAGWTLLALLGHWRRHPLQLATLLIGLISATALWSGVQAINEQARASYDRAAVLFGGARLATLVDRDGLTIDQQSFVDLRRSGWAVSPIVEGRVSIGAHTYRLIGVDPVTLPAEAGFGSGRDGETLQAFLAPPGKTFMAADVAADLGLSDGSVALANGGLLLPPVEIRPQISAGALIVDIGVAQRLLALPNQISRMVVAKKSIGPVRPLETIAAGRLRLVEPTAETDLEQLTGSFHLNLSAFGLLSFLVGLFIVNSAIGLTFEQRLPMVRTLRACGVGLTALYGCLVAELVLLAFVAGLVGLLLGFAVATVLLPNVADSLSALYGAQMTKQLSLSPQWWISGLAMSVAGALAAAAASFAKLRRLSLIAGAQPRAWLHAQQVWLRWQGVIAVVVLVCAVLILGVGESLTAGFAVLGALMLGAALGLPVVLGLLLRFGERGSRGPLVKWFWASSRQQLPGLSLALMALLLALAVNVGVGTMVESFRTTFISWLDGRLNTDVYVNARDGAQAAQIRLWLLDRPEVTAVLSGARAEAQLGARPIEVLGLSDDPTNRERWQLLEALPGAWDGLTSGGMVFVSEQLSRQIKLGLGDTVQVPTVVGIWPLRIVAIYADYGNPKGQIAVAFDKLTERFPNVARTRLGLRVRPEAVAPLISAMRAKFGLDNQQIADQTTMKSLAATVFNRTFSVTAALNTFTLGVAGIALLTSLLTLGNARLPQIAPLWAAGVPLQRLSVIELSKTMMLAVMTALLALPLGIAVAWCLVAVVNVKAFGWRLPLHVYPSQLGTLLLVAVAASLVANLLPILELRRLSPAQLIKILAQER